MPRFLIAALAVLTAATTSFAQGIIAPTAGPINSSMAGASVAAPVDFGGSYWNPAILSGLPRNEFLLGSQLLIPSMHMTSSLPAGAIDGVFPPTNRYGVARSDSGVASNLATGVSFRLSDDSKTTFGIGVFGMVGGGVNYAGSNTTPILTPRQPPNYFGVGPIYSSTSFLAINANRVATSDRPVGHRRWTDDRDRPVGLQSGLLRSGSEGRDSACPPFPPRPTRGRSGEPDFRSVCSTTSARTGTWVSRTRARSGKSGGASMLPLPTWPRAGSASRRKCPRSSPGASPTKGSSGP